MRVAQKHRDNFADERLAKLNYIDSATAQSYDRIRFSSRFGKFVNQREMYAISKLLEGAVHVRTILDAPCGTGRFFHLPSFSHCTLVAADISIEMIKVARSRLTSSQRKGAQFVNCDLEYLPFKESCVDLVLCIRLLSLMPPPLQMKIIAEFGRVTSKYLIASHADRWTAHGLIRRILAGLHLHTSGWYQVSSNAYLAQLRAANLGGLKTTRSLDHISETLFVAAGKLGQNDFE